MAVTPQTNTTVEELARFFEEHDDYVICGHVSPDGDCLGSQLALWHALRALGKNATCLLVKDEPVGIELAFLPGVESMVPACRFDGKAGVFVGTDVPSRERIGKDACAVLDRCQTSATIDHHAADVPMCEHVLVDPESASASLLVWEVVKALLDEPPVECALCAYTGLVTDTGCFRFQNADARAFASAAEFVARGVDPAFVAQKVYQNRTLASVRLEAAMTDRLELIANGSIALSWIAEQDMQELGAVKSDTEQLIETLRAIHGVRVACLLKEQDGKVRGSLRAKDDTDVSALAREFGGGGHRAAAGYTMEGPLAVALDTMRSKLELLVQLERDGSDSPGTCGRVEPSASR